MQTRRVLLTLGANFNPLRINSIKTTDIQVGNGLQFFSENMNVRRAYLY